MVVGSGGGEEGLQPWSSARGVGEGGVALLDFHTWYSPLREFFCRHSCQQHDVIKILNVISQIL